MQRRDLPMMVLVATSVFATVAAGANVLPLAPESAGSAVSPQHHVQVVLEREVVEVVPARNLAYRVVASFWLRSQARRAVTVVVGMPLPDNNLGTSYTDGFVVLVDGRPVDARLQPAETPGSAHWISWPVAWGPGQVRVVTCLYDVVVPESLSGLVAGTRIRYAVATGRHWQGTIGEAEFRFRLRPVWGPDSARRLVPSYPDHVVEQTADSVRWRFSDWVPGDEDLTLDLPRWRGPVPQGYRLPAPYRGAVAAYDDAWLDALAEAELDAVRPAFPSEAAALDLRELRRWIAEHLLMEIRARNGDLFVVGRDPWWSRIPWLGRLGFQARRPSRSLHDGTAIDWRWEQYFRVAAAMGGWVYQPARMRRTAFSLDELTGLERVNALYLLRVLGGES